MARSIGRTRRTGRVRLLLVPLAALLVAGCDKWIVTYDGTRAAPEMVDIVLTPDGTDAYSIESSGVRVQAVALPTNASANLRTAFWPAGAPSVPDSQSCAVWTDQTAGSQTQQGAALRVSTADGGATRAITVTKNIYGGFVWVFNIHLWDTARNPALTLVKQVNMGDVLHQQPFPWHVCARVVDTEVEMKVWTDAEPEPAWGDTTHGAAVTVGDEWVYPGTAGWFIGHLPPGGTADFAGLQTWRYGDPDDTTPAAGSRASTGSGMTADGIRISAAP